MKYFAVAITFSYLISLANSAALSSSPTNCKCFPGDACWPTDSQWSLFNETVNGRLIKTVPLGSPCHNPTYDAVRCEQLKKQWKLAPVQ